MFAAASCEPSFAFLYILFCCNNQTPKISTEEPFLEVCLLLMLLLLFLLLLLLM